MITILKWIFSDSGIVSGMDRAPDSALVLYLKGFQLSNYTCRVCHSRVWKRSGKRTVICHKLSCFKANGAKWS